MSIEAVAYHRPAHAQTQIKTLTSSEEEWTNALPGDAASSKRLVGTVESFVTASPAFISRYTGTGEVRFLQKRTVARSVDVVKRVACFMPRKGFDRKQRFGEKCKGVQSGAKLKTLNKAQGVK